MQIELELLAPAKNKDIGIAAIDCGADAVYIAGPSFGARESAGNSMEDIKELVEYADRFGVKIYIVINTILYDNELKEAERLVWAAYEAGCSAVIVQDMALLEMNLPPIRLFASTQTNIRSVEAAKRLEALGFERLILARELSLEQIAEIKRAIRADIETFVHGALCVSYSGQCYLSEYLTGRSANRGSCAQACRSLYTLVDSDDTVIAQNAPLLSLKDLNLGERLGDLVEAGVTSFKIEGRLKNESYIKNIVREYSIKLDRFIQEHPQYVRSSYGKVSGGFTPNPSLTFNRGFTTLNINGVRGRWNSGAASKYIGEPIAKVTATGRGKVGQLWFEYELLDKGKSPIVNGDGLSFSTGLSSEIKGLRANSCNGKRVQTTERMDIPVGCRIYRNYNFAFENELEKNMPHRLIPVNLTIKGNTIYAVAGEGDKGVSVSLDIEKQFNIAENQELAKRNLFTQLGKTSGIFSFTLLSADFSPYCNGKLPFFPASQLNLFRRNMAEMLNESVIARSKEERRYKRVERVAVKFAGGTLSYLGNCSNALSEKLYKSIGLDSIEPAYELSHTPEVELMRTKYCIKFELGLCSRRKGAQSGGGRFREPFYLLNGKRSLRLGFDCSRCEMVVIG